MQTVGLFDTWVAEPASETTVVYDPPFSGSGSSVHDALKLAGRLVQIPPMRISVSKAIPTRAGLGGGSSDAGGTLRAISALTQGSLSEQQCHEIAARIGMDVPFFLTGGLARCTGYGETLEAREDEAKRHFVIAKPPVDSATPDAYARLDVLPRELRPIPERLDTYSNDFEDVAPTECVELIRALMDAGALRATLSGSGSACFGEFASETEASRAACDLRAKALTWAVPSITAKESTWTLLS